MSSIASFVAPLLFKPLGVFGQYGNALREGSELLTTDDVARPEGGGSFLDFVTAAATGGLLKKEENSFYGHVGGLVNSLILPMALALPALAPIRGVYVALKIPEAIKQLIDGDIMDAGNCLLSAVTLGGGTGALKSIGRVYSRKGLSGAASRAGTIAKLGYEKTVGPSVKAFRAGWVGKAPKYPHVDLAPPVSLPPVSLVPAA